MANSDSRAMVVQLWASNFLNIRRATEATRSQGRRRLDIAIELNDMTFAASGDFHKYAADCLAYLSRTSFFGIHVWTLVSPEQMENLIVGKLNPANIYVRGQNENSLSKNVSKNGRKPWFDIILDTTSGFDPVAGHWYWAHVLFQVATESLANASSGQTFIRSDERFGKAIDPGIRAQLGPDGSGGPAKAT